MSANGETVQANGKNILVVEDDRYTNELVTSTLKMAGFQVVSVFTGEAAVEQVAKELPDLIVLDLLLPTMDGWEVFRSLRKAGSPAQIVPVLVASVVARYNFDPADVASGTLSLFNKPFLPNELLAEVQRMLGAVPA